MLTRQACGRLRFAGTAGSPLATRLSSQLQERSGGTTVVQDPADAAAPSMPRSAAKHVEIDHKAPLSKLAPLLVRLSKEHPRAGRRIMSERLRIEAEIAAGDIAGPDAVAK